MKTTLHFCSRITRLSAAMLALMSILGAARAQPTFNITLTQLIAQGFTNGPVVGGKGYSLNVTGIRNISSAVFTDIRAEGGAPSPHGGTIRVYGLNYTVASASVGGGQLTFSGSISLPPPLNQYEAAVANAQGMRVGTDGNIGFASPGGTFTIPRTFKIGSLTIDSVTLTINPAAQTFGGSALIGIGDGPSGSYCPGFTPGPALYGAGVQVVGGKLNELSVNGSNLRRPLGTSGAFLDVLGGTVGNLAENGGRNWMVTASATVNAGCKVNDVFPLSIDAQATVNSAGFIEIKGSGKVFDIPAGAGYLRYTPPYTVAAGASVTFANAFFAECGFQVTAGPQFSGFGRGRLEIPRYVPVAGGFTFAQAEASFNNSGFRGSVTLNLTPEIPRTCTPRWCLPGGCLPYWCPTWSNPGRTCKACWKGPCFPEICFPRIPAVSATVGFKFQSGVFSFGLAPTADLMVEPWEKSFQETIVEPTTGDSLTFLSNWKRVDKASTGKRGRPLALAGFGLDVTAPPIQFQVPFGEESVMFRLTWENPENFYAFMKVGFADYPELELGNGEVNTNTHVLVPLDTGTPFGQGAYYIIDGSRREAIIGIPHPAEGTYTVQIDHIENLGNYSVELLRQNIAPSVSVNTVVDTATPGVYSIYYSSIVRQGTPSTRIILAQAACKPGTTQQVKAGGIYVVDTFPTVSGGENVRDIDTRSLNVPDGDYNVVVNVDDPASVEVEAFSTRRISVRNTNAPSPVPSFATRSDNRGFTVQWEPSPSSNLLGYIVAYSKSAMAHDYEFNFATDASARTATITNLDNGHPYLVTIFAMGTNELQSCPAEKQRVIPTEGYGLNSPLIVSAPRVVATVGQTYIYMPEIFDADNEIRPSSPLPNDGIEEPPATDSADDQGRQWTLLTAPAGMTIGSSNGFIMWTPVEGQVGSNTVTVRVTDLSSVPPLQDAGSLVRPRFSEQAYNITVVGANNPPALERNHYRFLTTAPATAHEGEVYRYVPIVLFPTNTFTLSIDDGPVGLTVVEEGTAPDTTNVVVWNVPTNAIGHRVVLRASPNIEGGATPDDIVLQEFFLNVSAPSKQLPQPTVITRSVPTPEGFGLSWVGNAANYLVQRATNMPSGPTLNLNFNNPLPVGAAIYGNAYLDSTNGELQITGDTADDIGALLIQDFAAGQTVSAFDTSFRLKILPTSTPLADGLSFNWATDLPDDVFSEEGVGNGLTVSFDFYDNGDNEAPSIDVKWNGVTVAHQSVPIGLFINASNYADVRISLHSDATIDVTYAGQAIYTRQPVPGAIPLAGARFNIGGRCGDYTSIQRLDDLSIQLTAGANVWQNITATRPGAAVNYHVDTNAVPPRAFYRILAVP